MFGKRKTVFTFREIWDKLQHGKRINIMSDIAKTLFKNGDISEMEYDLTMREIRSADKLTLTIETIKDILRTVPCDGMMKILKLMIEGYVSFTVLDSGDVEAKLVYPETLFKGQ